MVVGSGRRNGPDSLADAFLYQKVPSGRSEGPTGASEGVCVRRPGPVELATGLCRASPLSRSPGSGCESRSFGMGELLECQVVEYSDKLVGGL